MWKQRFRNVERVLDYLKNWLFFYRSILHQKKIIMELFIIYIWIYILLKTAQFSNCYCWVFYDTLFSYILILFTIIFRNLLWYKRKSPQVNWNIYIFIFKYQIQKMNPILYIFLVILGIDMFLVRIGSSYNIQHQHFVIG